MSSDLLLAGLPRARSLSTITVFNIRSDVPEQLQLPLFCQVYSCTMSFSVTVLFLTCHSNFLSLTMISISTSFVLISELSMGWVDPWVGLGWVELDWVDIFNFSVG